MLLTPIRGISNEKFLGGTKLIEAKKKIYNDNQINEELTITRTRISDNHGVVQVDGNLIFAINFKSQEWKYFDSMASEWIPVNTSHLFYDKYVLPIIDYFQNSYPL